MLDLCMKHQFKVINDFFLQFLNLHFFKDENPNFSLFYFSSLRDVSVVEEPRPHYNLPEFPKFSDAEREELLSENVDERKLHSGRIGNGVTEEAQAIFDFLSRTYAHVRFCFVSLILFLIEWNANGFVNPYMFTMSTLIPHIVKIAVTLKMQNRKRFNISAKL
jgi:hypothetical protein